MPASSNTKAFIILLAESKWKITSISFTPLFNFQHTQGLLSMRIPPQKFPAMLSLQEHQCHYQPHVGLHAYFWHIAFV
jgi:hypothetical protein